METKLGVWYAKSIQSDSEIAYSLAFFRVIFGILLLIAEARFILKGWIADFYVKPQYFFKFYGFEWIHPLPEPYIYWVFYALIVLSLLITLGFAYRIAIVGFLIAFTYVELLDKSVYLNHYYQVSLLAFLMCFLPMNATFSIDSILARKYHVRISSLPLQSWMLWALRLQVGSVYVFGGVAKLRYDWLINAQPLRIWLAANEHIPLIGGLLTEKWVAFLISWLAMIFDLSAPFLLCFKKTRTSIYIVIVVFHLLTHYLFYIGMFPWIMMTTALIFFPKEIHKKVLSYFGTWDVQNTMSLDKTPLGIYPILLGFMAIQMVLPFRSYLYAGNVLWHEQGFRFAWNIMLMEKNASIEYHVKIKKTGETFSVRPIDFLTKIQARQMSFQPDMILQFAHYLHQYYLENGVGDTEVRAECYASLNGRGSQLLINPNVDLATQQDGFCAKSWVTELK